MHSNDDGPIFACLNAGEGNDFDDEARIDASSYARGFVELTPGQVDSINRSTLEVVEGAPSIINLRRWKPTQAGLEPEMAAAGGFSDDTSDDLPGGGTIKIAVKWNKGDFELTWTVSDYFAESHLMLAFADHASGQMLGHVQDLGKLENGKHCWPATVNELGFPPSTAWEIWPFVISSTRSAANGQY